MPISDRQPRRAIAAAALLACGLFITPASARHSDIPDLPPVPPSTAAFAIAAMQVEVTAFQRSAAAPLIDPSPQPPLAPQAAQVSRRIDQMTTHALRELASLDAPPAEFAVVLNANAAAQRALATIVAQHACHAVPPMPPPGFEPGTKRL